VPLDSRRALTAAACEAPTSRNWRDAGLWRLQKRRSRQS